tara:strand:- start:7117 stop:7812 length:696 start_codon:yes stop_codon:yes gene_type:complete
LKQERRLRLGDHVDDYCPRERRITNHAVVAMVSDEIKQTRCSTCDAEHEYKAAKAPPKRKPKAPAALGAPATAGAARAEDAATDPESATTPTAPPDVMMATEDAHTEADIDDENANLGASAPETDEGPVRRPLIRATLPRIEGQVSERRTHEFTIRQSNGRNGNGGDGNGWGSGKRQVGTGGQGNGGGFAKRSRDAGESQSRADSGNRRQGRSSERSKSRSRSARRGKKSS